MVDVSFYTVFTQIMKKLKLNILIVQYNLWLPWSLSAQWSEVFVDVSFYTVFELKS